MHIKDIYVKTHKQDSKRKRVTVVFSDDSTVSQDILMGLNALCTKIDFAELGEKLIQAPTSEDLTDTSIIDFGKYEGKMLQDVPADYLHWLWHSHLQHKVTDKLHKYIRKNISTLEEENDDLIWSKPK